MDTEQGPYIPQRQSRCTKLYLGQRAISQPLVRYRYGARTLIFTVYHLVCDVIDMGQTVEIQGSCRRESVSGSLLWHGRVRPTLGPAAGQNTTSNFEAALPSIEKELMDL
jgi:hypothetical protein